MATLPLQQKRALCFLMAVVGGALLWLLAPQFFGMAVPWQGNVLHYAAALFTLGFGLRLVMVALPMSVFYGCIAGQFFGFLFPHFKLAQLLPLPALFLLLFSLFAYLGAWIAQHLR